MFYQRIAKSVIGCEEGEDVPQFYIAETVGGLSANHVDDNGITVGYIQARQFPTRFVIPTRIGAPGFTKIQIRQPMVHPAMTDEEKRGWELSAILFKVEMKLINSIRWYIWMWSELILTDNDYDLGAHVDLLP